MPGNPRPAWASKCEVGRPPLPRRGAVGGGGGGGGGVVFFARPDPFVCREKAITGR